MKKIKFLFLAIIPLLFTACSEEIMDEINEEKNNALTMSSQSMLPDIIVKSAFETAGTDIGWYATVYIEHSAGTWAQSVDADKRIGQASATLFNNNWNNLYDVMNTCKVILDKTAPDGPEADNLFVRGIAQVLTAYNLGVTTDMWGEIPWTEALNGSDNLQPVYDKQSAIYPDIFKWLDDGIATLESVTTFSTAGDYIYSGDVDAWIKAAYSLKARHWMRLSNVDANASANALTAIANGFVENTDNFIFDSYEATAIGENPWYQFMNDRSHLSVSQSMYDLMDARTDPRIGVYFELLEGVVVPAPNGTAEQSQGGIYSWSLLTINGQTTGTPIMTNHELRFIEAEALFRTDPAGAAWQAALQSAIEANFVFHGLVLADGTDYFNNEVVPLLAGNEVNEILTQKYLALYEHEAAEAYNDYRRVPEFLTLDNPNNTTTGFVWRFPYPTSEESSNSANMPVVDVYSDKTWWAGGSEF